MFQSLCHDPPISCGSWKGCQKMCILTKCCHLQIVSHSKSFPATTTMSNMLWTGHRMGFFRLILFIYFTFTYSGMICWEVTSHFQEHSDHIHTVAHIHTWKLPFATTVWPAATEHLLKTTVVLMRKCLFLFTCSTQIHPADPGIELFIICVHLLGYIVRICDFLLFQSWLNSPTHSQMQMMLLQSKRLQFASSSVSSCAFTVNLRLYCR